jgi:hypothetical protein
MSVWQVGWIILSLVFVCFVFVVAFGAPYLPTLKQQIGVAFDLASLKPGDTLLELGSGDGRVLIAAAERGINAVGYELNPLLFAYSWIRTLKYRKLVKVKLGNFWKAKWPQADGIFVFLLQPFMEKLNKKIIHAYAGQNVKLVSFAFTIKSKEPAKEQKGLFLYQYK